MSSVVQSGLFTKWTKVNWARQLSNMKIAIEQEDGSNEHNLTLNQVSTTFYILICCLPLSMVKLLIKIFCIKLKIIKNK